MNGKHLRRVCAMCALAGATFAQPAAARVYDFSGENVNTRDVAKIEFTLAQDVAIGAFWTDSYNDGKNFDPAIALWRDGFLLARNDDNPTVAEGQTLFDAGLVFNQLTAGTYVLTISTYPNSPVGPLLEQGFSLDSANPTPVNGASHWSAHFNDAYVLNPASDAPEPGASMMLLAGLGIVGLFVRRRQQQG